MNNKFSLRITEAHFSNFVKILKSQRPLTTQVRGRCFAIYSKP